MRPWQERDRDAFATLNADPEVMIDAPRPLTREKSDRKFDRYCRAWEKNGVCNWALEDRHGRFVGYAGLMPKDEVGSLGPHLSAGWRLARWAWGQGFATEAAEAAFKDGLSRLGTPIVYAYTSPDNLRSRAVMARLGLRRDPLRDFTTNEGTPWQGLVWFADAEWVSKR